MNKRLLFITPLFPKKPTEDHIVPFINQFINEFADNSDIQVDVISLIYPFTTTPYKFNNVTVYPIGSNFVKPIKMFFYLFKAIYKGVILGNKNKYDGVLCFWYREASFVGVFLSKILKLKLRVWFLGQDIQKSNKYIPLLRIKPEKLIMISEQQRDFFYINHNVKVNTVANVAVDRKRFAKLNLGERPIDVIGVGNTGFLKNYVHFAEIIASLKEEFPTIRAVICGRDAGQKRILDNRIRELNLTDNIEFTGEVSQKIIFEYMNESKVFLHTSKSEGGGLVMHEALYAGCKVVSTIEIKNSDDITDYFFFSTDTNKLKNKIREFLKSESKVSRQEKFKIEDTVEIIKKSFYS